MLFVTLLALPVFAILASVESLVYGCRAYVILYCNLLNDPAFFMKNFHFFLLLRCKYRLLGRMYLFDRISIGNFLDSDKAKWRTLFFKPNFTSFSVALKPMSQVELFLGQFGNGLSDEDIIEIADKRFARYPNNYIDGYRTKAIFVQAAILCKAGIPKEKALKYLKEHFLPTGYVEWKLEYETARAYSKWNDNFGLECGNYRP